MKSIKDIADRIRKELVAISHTEYFVVWSDKGESIKIRVGNHSCNRLNNNGQLTLSFVTKRTAQRKSGYNASPNEWEIDEESMLTDTYQTIEEVLEWEGVADDQQTAKQIIY